MRSYNSSFIPSKVFAGINGFLRDDEALLLYHLAKNCKGQGVIVEIGSWEGKSTVCLGLGSLKNSGSKIYAIDPHTGSSEHQKDMGKVNTFTNFKRNIQRAKVSKIVIPLVMTSHKALGKVNKPVDLLFIDGAHDYKSVKQDFNDWFPKVVDGGVIAFHDTISWPGPKKVVKDKVFKSRYFKKIGVIGSITFGEKTNQSTLIDYFKNQYVYLMKTFREVISRVSIPSPIHNLLKKIYYKIQ